MRLMNSMIVLLWATLFPTTMALNIFLTTEDSWVSANVRTLYNKLIENNHQVILVAPLTDQSDIGSYVYINQQTSVVSSAGEFDYYVKENQSPMYGQDPVEKNIWYVDGSTVGATIFGLDYIIPQFYSNESIDLVIAGPKEGQTIGPLDQHSSGVFSVAKFCSLRGIPSISISTTDDTHRFFQTEEKKLTKFFKFEKASKIYSKLIVELLKLLENYSINHTTEFGYHDFKTSRSKFIDQHNFKKFNELDQKHDISDDLNIKPKILPSGVGLNINFPQVGDASRVDCINPNFVQTNSFGSYGLVPTVYLDEDSNLFRLDSVYSVDNDLSIDNLNCDLLQQQLQQDPHDLLKEKTFNTMRLEERKFFCNLPTERSIMDSCSISITAFKATGGDAFFDMTDILNPKESENAQPSSDDDVIDNDEDHGIFEANDIKNNADGFLMDQT
ncbi:hypothetical protein PACTADRAFT_4663 [Pachysolen tannophilus NRRL Y-2460]|uniref:Survival protein SurE-like phosphatase/nucleotidase domain-containing protein n=1 Tax=Pachysolen tannophilus NRRL Y-2460 TaxID=669874 RepID=A0A1E4TPT2_PACTA|nr:hypothetical protein PACTADRAFT_4663 [Pachysolen tannophilus NRRL Y-2460]